MKLAYLYFACVLTTAFAHDAHEGETLQNYAQRHVSYRFSLQFFSILNYNKMASEHHM